MAAPAEDLSHVAPEDTIVDWLQLTEGIREDMKIYRDLLSQQLLINNFRNMDRPEKFTYLAMQIIKVLLYRQKQGTGISYSDLENQLLSPYPEHPLLRDIFMSAWQLVRLCKEAAENPQLYPGLDHEGILNSLIVSFSTTK